MALHSLPGTDKPRVKQMLSGLEGENARLVGIIADALAAMDEGRMGDVRRILKTGYAAPVMATTLVIGKPGPV